ncbi:MAG: Nif11-like leader peptide family natural product precursor [Eggerthellaceae bacterium]|nr:Nif11-like leader peptide family natural product precursor [Eggerthellaceae bacterium]
MKYEDLSPEMQEKVKACKSPEELLALAKEEGYELTDEELEGVAGGWGDCDNYEPEHCRTPFWR